VSISGSGNNNRVTKKDLLAYLEQRSSATAPATEAPAAMEQPEVSVSAPVISPLADERIEMDKMRRSIAEHMRHSLDTSAHVHLMNEVDMTRIVNYVDENSSSFKMREGFPLTYTPFIVSACVRALQTFPDMNSSLDGTSIIRKKNVNIGLAVAVDAGLMVPVIPQCEELNFLGLCRKVRDLAIRTRNKQIRPDELSGSTFSISNFGMFNVTTGTPIINQPNVGILGVGTIKKKPVVIETKQGDTIGIRSMMFLSIGFDHRLVDGAGGAKFVETVQKNLENMDLEHLF
jgi:2-oxoglutarate dehydrogenase E2 component (dihydrolipoamide succinyltransferase)